MLAAGSGWTEGPSLFEFNEVDLRFAVQVAVYGRALSREIGGTVGEAREAAAASALRTLSAEPTSADGVELASLVHRK